MCVLVCTQFFSVPGNLEVLAGSLIEPRRLLYSLLGLTESEVEIVENVSNHASVHETEPGDHGPSAKGKETKGSIQHLESMGLIRTGRRKMIADSSSIADYCWDNMDLLLRNLVDIVLRCRKRRPEDSERAFLVQEIPKVCPNVHEAIVTDELVRRFQPNVMIRLLGIDGNQRPDQIAGEVARSSCSEACLMVKVGNRMMKVTDVNDMKGDFRAQRYTWDIPTVMYSRRFCSTWRSLRTQMKQSLDTEHGQRAFKRIFAAVGKPRDGMKAMADSLLCFVKDEIKYVKKTSWLSPEETAQYGFGDCKAKALLLRFLFEMAGISSYIVYGVVMGRPHCWVEAEIDSALLVYDPTSLTHGILKRKYSNFPTGSFIEIARLDGLADA